MKLTFLLAALICLSSVFAQQCSLTSVKGEKEFVFHLNSPVKKKAYLSVTDAAGNIKWVKKVKIKKGDTNPKLVFADLTPGKYVIRIGDFFKQEVVL